MYDAGGDRLLMVASDRISTYDVVHPTPIPDKGKVLTGLSVFWFERTGADRAQPLISATEGVPERGARAGAGRARGCRCCRSSASCAATSRARAGRTTSATGTVCGIELPEGLRESEQLPEPIFTPTTKAEGRPRRDDRLRPRGGARRRPALIERAARALAGALRASRPSTRASAA